MREYLGSTAYELATEKLRAPTTLKERLVTVSNSVTEILPNNPRRLSWHVCNRSSSPVYFAFSTELTIGNGFFLDANGGFASMTVAEDGEAVGYSVYAISASESAIVRVSEVYTL